MSNVRSLSRKEKKLKAEEYISFYEELKHVKNLMRNAATPEAKKALENLAYYIIVQHNRGNYEMSNL